MTDYKPAWQATWDGLAADLQADREARKRAERSARATSELSKPPKPRSHAERMAAAHGVHVYGDNLRTTARQQAAIARHRQQNG